MRYLKILMILLSSILFVQCLPDLVPIENYKGAVIMEKDKVERKTEKHSFDYLLKLKYKDQIIQTRVLPADADRYNVLDTIK